MVATDSRFQMMVLTHYIDIDIEIEIDLHFFHNTNTKESVDYDKTLCTSPYPTSSDQTHPNEPTSLPVHSVIKWLGCHFESKPVRHHMSLRVCEKPDIATNRLRTEKNSKSTSAMHDRYQPSSEKPLMNQVHALVSKI